MVVVVVIVVVIVVVLSSRLSSHLLELFQLGLNVFSLLASLSHKM